MLKLKKILFMLLALSLVLVVASCGGAENGDCKACVDGDGDGICDVCKKEIPEEEVADVPLFEDGKPTFQIVLTKDASDDVKSAVESTLTAKLNDAYKVTVNSFTEESEDDSAIDVEILIGNVTTRGEKYDFDEHTLGKEGFVIKIIGTKIIVNGGSDDMLIAAIEDFSELLVKKAGSSDVFFTKDDTVLEIQDDYKITSFKVAGTDMKDYTIAADLTRKYYEDSAIYLQDAIYEDTGYWLPIVPLDDATQKSIVMKHVDKASASESFKVTANGSQLVIDCAYDNRLEIATAQFATNKIATARGDVDFKGTVYTQDISVVYYEEFGAVGDGRTDDFGAIYATHEFANECGQTVKATAGKNYYIKDTTLGTDTVHIAKIKTNVDWCGADFTIDDTNLTVMVEYPDERKIAQNVIFKVEPDEEHNMFIIDDEEFLANIAAQGLNQQTKKIDLGIDWDGPVMIVPYNSSHGVFRRPGMSQYNGGPMHEIIVVEADGTISEETPIMFSYAHIDYMEVYKLDPSSAITIENGVFTTLESRINHYLPTEEGTLEYNYDGYIYRGINVQRSYTTLKNVEHRTTGGYSLLDRAERNLEGAMYHGFFGANNANHVTFKDCILQGRTSPGPGNGHSSYGISTVQVNKPVFDGCVQSNFWVYVDPVTYEITNATEYDKDAVGYAKKSRADAIAGMGSVNVNGVTRRLCWGISGTNYCKNLEFINSTLTRIDAHAGLYNGKVINSNVSCMALTGYGDFIVEDSDWYQYAETSQNQLLQLRSDYGYHWSGDISVKNVNAYLLNLDEFIVAGYSYSNWYYGYTCAFPDITIDTLRFYDQRTGDPLKTGLKGYLFKFTSKCQKMHLDDSGISPVFQVNDYDGNGYVDEPRFISDTDGTFYPERDLDGDGKIGNTSLSYDYYMNLPDRITGGVARPGFWAGATHPNSTVNLNRVRPPSYFKVLNNENENGEVFCVYMIENTAGISDGGWHRDANSPDTMGGYFGNTKFYYGEGENDYFFGSDHEGQTITATFDFTK